MRAAPGPVSRLWSRHAAHPPGRLGRPARVSAPVSGPVGQVDALAVPRFAGGRTLARRPPPGPGARVPPARVRPPVSGPVGQVDALAVPRFAGVRTFARLPTTEQVGRADVAVLGAPFDWATTFRPGSRFGPAALRGAP